MEDIRANENPKSIRETLGRDRIGQWCLTKVFTTILVTLGKFQENSADLRNRAVTSCAIKTLKKKSCISLNFIFARHKRNIYFIKKFYFIKFLNTENCTFFVELC